MADTNDGSLWFVLLLYVYVLVAMLLATNDIPTYKELGWIEKDLTVV